LGRAATGRVAADRAAAGRAATEGGPLALAGPGQVPRTGLPRRLAVVHDAHSASPLEVARALGDEAELVWVVDESLPLGPMGAMLHRLGTVVGMGDGKGGLPLEAVRALGAAGVQGVVAFSDTQLARANALALALGVAANPAEVIGRCLDKHEQRRAFALAGLSVPSYLVLSEGLVPSVLEAAIRFPFPAVLKPRHGSGSRDTHHVEDPGALRMLLHRAGDEGLCGQELILEEYLASPEGPGDPDVADYVSVESVGVNGEVHHLAVTGKFPLEPPYRETGNFQPSHLTAEQEGAVVALAGQAARALGVRYGVLHTEIKLTPEGPRLIEANARVGGGGIGTIFSKVFGVSLLALAGRAALGMAPTGPFRPTSPLVAFELFVQAPRTATRLEALGGIEAVGRLSGVDQISPHRRVGDPLDWREGSQGYVLSVRGTAADHQELARLRRAILGRLQLAYA